MKGIARTQKEIEFHDRVAQLGCISCRQEGNYNPWVSIHHAHGRTKPGCHMWVLPLCEPHHQDNGTAIARHPYKRRWEAKYGNEDDLIRAMWTELGVEFTEPVRVAKPVDKDRPKRATSEGAEVGVVKLREIKPKVDRPVKATIKSTKTSSPSAANPTLPKTKISSQAKTKIQNAGFKKTSNLSSVKGKRLSSKTKGNELDEYKERCRVAAKARKKAYLEENKEKIESEKIKRRNSAKESREHFKKTKKN